MRFAVFTGDNEIKRLPNGLIRGIAEHCCRATTPVSDDTESIGEDYDFSFHKSPSIGLNLQNQTVGFDVM